MALRRFCRHFSSAAAKWRQNSIISLILRGLSYVLYLSELMVAFTLPLFFASYPL